MPSIHGAQWDHDEEFRESVIRKALLLGFSAEEKEECWRDQPHHRWSFKMYCEDEQKCREYTGYHSLYSAAFDYLRLMKVPSEVIGDYRG